MEMLGPLKQKLSDEKSGGATEQDPVAEAIKQNALDILRRAWAVAEERQRKMFIGFIKPDNAAPPS